MQVTSLSRRVVVTAIVLSTYLSAAAVAQQTAMTTKPSGAPATTQSSERKKVPEMKLTIQGRPEHPTVYLSRADLARARDNRAKHDWAKAAAAKLLKEADEWAAKDDATLRGYIPAPGAAFAYGFTGCPECGARLGSWWGQGGACSLDRPGKVKCDNGHLLPNEKYPDPGTGYVDPKTKKIHYLVGSYNSYVIDTLNAALADLVHAYGLTNERKYGEKAALILDELARIYPACDKGSWDYPSSPPSGRFNRPWYQVARTLILYTNHYDLLMNDESGARVLETPSSVEGLTKRQNVERNLLLNGAKYCYEESVRMAALNNGEADYIRGCLAVGVAMGIPEYVEWGVHGPYGILNMLANNIDRDGQYYETSSGYSHHSRYLYMNIAEVLHNYRDDGRFKDGVNLATHPKFRALYMFPNARLNTAGNVANLGDDAPRPNWVDDQPGTAPDPRDLDDLEHLLALKADPELAQLLLAAAGGTPEKLAQSRAKAKDTDWLLFHAEDVQPAGDVTPIEEIRHPLTGARLAESDLLGQRGLALLRASNGAGDVVATLRAGPTLNHGHFDELNLNLYAYGHNLTYDLGYGLGSTHTQVGWAKQSASHNLVLVDEASQLQTGPAGGTVERFVAIPGLSLVTANDPAAYRAQGVDLYRRTVMLAGDGEYLFDVFRVRGGKKHDYVFHGQGLNLAFDGVSLGEKQQGSLAGPDVDWGARLGSDGDVTDIPNKPYWNPPPGNGFGFLMYPRTGVPTGTWSATWTVDGGDEHPGHLRLTMLPAADVTITAADGPGIYPYLPKAGYVYARRAGQADPGLGSTFAAVIEPYTTAQSRRVKEVRSLASPAAGADAAVAAKVMLGDGSVDYVFENARGATWQDAGLALAIDAAVARVRVGADGKVSEVFVVDGKSVAAGEQVAVRPAREAYEGAIERIDFDRNVLYTKAELPEGDVLAGQFLNLGNEHTHYRSSYRIARVSRDGGLTAIELAPTTLILGRAHLQTDPPDGKTLPNVVPLEYGKALGRKDSGFFTGKTLATPDGKVRTRAVAIEGKDGTTFGVVDSTGFAAGDDVVIYDVQPGDTFRLPAWTRLTRDAGTGKWSVQGTVDAAVQADGAERTAKASVTAQSPR